MVLTCTLQVIHIFSPFYPITKGEREKTKTKIPFIAG